MPFAQGLTIEQVAQKKREAVVTKTTETVVTSKTAAAIVTALQAGPCSALDLSQRLENVTHANARQTLRRLAVAGVVTKPARGIYGLPGCDRSTTNAKGSTPKAAKPDRCDRSQGEYDDAQERGEVATGNRTRDFGVADANAKPATAADLGIRRDEIEEYMQNRQLAVVHDEPGIIGRPPSSATIRAVWAHFEALNDPFNPEAWA